jgi:murein tripeptide amidase MpaA
MFIDAAFHGGNIEVMEVDEQVGSDGLVVDRARLRIRPDAPTITLDGPGAHSQWFSFRAVGAPGRSCRFVIENAGQTSYPDGWPGYRVACSEDGVTWRRVDTCYDTGQLHFSHTPSGGVAWYAYFAPYGEEQHARLLGRAVAAGARAEVLGRTVDGRPIDLLTVGERGPSVWVLGRQHPGETMASWWMDGFVGRLLDRHDPLGRTLRSCARWFIVPNMNPDGSARGHLRVNAAGSNLNRVWADPSPQTAPEVFHVRGRMDQEGVALCLDVHGDEGLPYVFIAGAQGTPSWDAGRQALHDLFCDTYVAASPDFQRQHGYPEDRPGLAQLAMCTAGVAERYRCLAMTLEMPFKDNANLPDAEQGWSPERSVRLGAAALDPFGAVLAKLKT